MSRSISVVMPCKNSEKTISRSILSVLQNLNPDDEFLIYDDGSRDGTPDILNLISDKRVKVFRGQESIGPGPASNFLVSNSQNELISRFDSDDLALPNRFSDSLRREVIQDVDFVFTNMILFGQGWVIPQPPRSFSGQELHKHLIIGNQLNNPTMIGKKNIFLKHGGYGVGVGGDKSLWLRLALAEVPMKLLKRYTVMYRVHKNQVTKSDLPKNPEVKRLERQLAEKLIQQK